MNISDYKRVAETIYHLEEEKYEHEKSNNFYTTYYYKKEKKIEFIKMEFIDKIITTEDGINYVIYILKEGSEMNYYYSIFREDQNEITTIEYDKKSDKFLIFFTENGYNNFLERIENLNDVNIINKIIEIADEKIGKGKLHRLLFKKDFENAYESIEEFKDDLIKFKNEKSCK